MSTMYETNRPSTLINDTRWLLRFWKLIRSCKIGMAMPNKAPETGACVVRRVVSACGGVSRGASVLRWSAWPRRAARGRRPGRARVAYKIADTTLVRYPTCAPNKFSRAFCNKFYWKNSNMWYYLILCFVKIKHDTRCFRDITLDRLTCMKR